MKYLLSVALLIILVIPAKAYALPDGILDGHTFYLSNELGDTSNPITDVSDYNSSHLTYINNTELLWVEVPDDIYPKLP